MTTFPLQRASSTLPPSERAKHLRTLTWSLLTEQDLSSSSLPANVQVMSKQHSEMTMLLADTLPDLLSQEFKTNDMARFDVGVVDGLTDLICQTFSAPYLKTALELLVPHTLDVNNVRDIVTKHILLLHMAEIPAAKWAHRVAYNIISLVHMLDRYAMTSSNQNPLRPPLFQPSASIKSSIALITQMSRLLSAPGHSPNELVNDLVKSLPNLSLTYVQSKLDDFDYRCVDPNDSLCLSDGIVLLEVARRYCPAPPLPSTIRVPAISRLQKIHNVSMLFSQLQATLSPEVWAKFTVRDVVNNRNDAAWKLMFTMLHHFTLKLSHEERHHAMRVIENIAITNRHDETFSQTLKRLISENPRRFPCTLTHCTDETLLMTWATVVLAKRGFHVRSNPHSFESGVAFVELIAILMTAASTPCPVAASVITHDDWIPPALLDPDSRALVEHTRKQAFMYLEDFWKRTGMMGSFPSLGRVLIPEVVDVFLVKLFRRHVSSSSSSEVMSKPSLSSPGEFDLVEIIRGKVVSVAAPKSVSVPVPCSIATNTTTPPGATIPIPISIDHDSDDVENKQPVMTLSAHHSPTLSTLLYKLRHWRRCYENTKPNLLQQLFLTDALVEELVNQSAFELTQQHDLVHTCLCILLGFRDDVDVVMATTSLLQHVHGIMKEKETRMVQTLLRLHMVAQ